MNKATSIQFKEMLEILLDKTIKVACIYIQYNVFTTHRYLRMFYNKVLQIGNGFSHVWSIFQHVQTALFRSQVVTGYIG